MKNRKNIIVSSIILLYYIHLAIMEHAYGIAARIKQRGGVRPIYNWKPKTENELQENKDAIKLTSWRNYVMQRRPGIKCPVEIKIYLDEEIPGWSGLTYLSWNVKVNPVDDIDSMPPPAKRQKTI
jgi:hypothetical protein